MHDLEKHSVLNCSQTGRMGGMGWCLSLQFIQSRYNLGTKSKAYSIFTSLGLDFAILCEQ